jgi:TonB family protein
MRMRCFLVLLVLFSICLGARIAPAQNSSNQDSSSQDSSKQVQRKVIKRAMPRYPDIARRISLAGTVRVIAVVSPDGKVKQVEPVGGSPLLVQAAQDAVFQWRFAPAGGESREVIELHFNPQADQ